MLPLAKSISLIVSLFEQSTAVVGSLVKLSLWIILVSMISSRYKHFYTMEDNTGLSLPVFFECLALISYIVRF